MTTLEFDLAEAFLPLLEPKRYKVMYGGRGSGKSWSAARVLLLLGKQKKLRILCAREIQNSIQESVHSLLSQQIGNLGFDDFYEIQKTAIYGKNGTEFFFSGLRHKIDSLKSFEGCDICWIEEAQVVSKSSWDKLTPTIRKENSQIWLTLNPELETDSTYQRFVLNPPEDAWVRKISYLDNPWFSDELRAEMRTTRLRSEDDYQHIWLGCTKQTLEGAVYAKELRQSRAEGRITNVPYDQSKQVMTFWDLGFSDATAIFFVQKAGFEYHVIDYYENHQEHLAHYINVLQEKKYNYGDHFLPHDAQSKTLGAPSIENQFKELTGRKPQIVSRAEVAVGINALRMLFPRLWFDQNKCADGLQMLSRYCYAVDEDTGQFGRRPEHTEASHAADSLRYLAMSNRTPRERPKLELVKKPVVLNFQSRNTAWMGR